MTDHRWGDPQVQKLSGSQYCIRCGVQRGQIESISGCQQEEADAWEEVRGWLLVIGIVLVISIAVFVAAHTDLRTP